MKKYWYLFFVPVFIGLTACHDDKEEPEQREQRESYLSCPDNHHPHLINLGLPSGTLWACCNVGATAPENSGGYYAWGETEEKSEGYDWKNYIYSNGSQYSFIDIGLTICGTEYDVAHVKWGGYWQMPSFEQIQELIAKCSHEWTEVNGTKGIKFIGVNGGSIFMPAAWRKIKDNPYKEEIGCYWSGTRSFPVQPTVQDDKYNYLYVSKAYELHLSKNSCGFYGENREFGLTVRPVAK